MRGDRGRRPGRASHGRRRRSPASGADAPRPAEPQDPAGNDELFASLYDQLRIIARFHMRQQSPAHTLQPTALVNEAFVKLTRRGDDWKNRGHFLSAATTTMRHILVDHARTRSRVRRRRPTGRRGDVDLAVDAYQERQIDLVALDEALRRMAEHHPRAANIVELRYFGELSLPQISQALGLKLRTVEREWQWARIWLHAELS